MFATNNLQIPVSITGNLAVDADNANSTNDVNTIDVDRTDSAWTFNVGARQHTALREIRRHLAAHLMEPRPCLTLVAALADSSRRAGQP